MSDELAVDQRWLAVIGRSLAYICAQSAGINTKTLAEQASFLESLGLERVEVAAMLGITNASITEALSRAKRNKKGKKKNAKKKGR